MVAEQGTQASTQAVLSNLSNSSLLQLSILLWALVVLVGSEL